MSTEGVSADPAVGEAERRHEAERDDEVRNGREVTPPGDGAEGRLRRVLADLDNLRKRFGREVERERTDERARVAAEWLPVLDNLELALQHAGEDSPAFVEGVRAIHDQAVGVLTRLGFPPFEDDVGAPFDPTRHQAVGAADSDAPPGTVVAIVRPGYGRDDRILRPASVIVAREPLG
jgi:molecular chaperone GrpE